MDPEADQVINVYSETMSKPDKSDKYTAEHTTRNGRTEMGRNHRYQ